MLKGRFIFNVAVCTTCLQIFINESLLMKNTNDDCWNDEIFLGNNWSNKVCFVVIGRRIKPEKKSIDQLS